MNLMSSQGSTKRLFPGLPIDVLDCIVAVCVGPFIAEVLSRYVSTLPSVCWLGQDELLPVINGVTGPV